MSQQRSGSADTVAVPPDPARRSWGGLDKKRLAAEIVQVERRYDDLAGRQHPVAEAIRERLEAVHKQLVEEAKRSLTAGNVEAGWKFLQELEREMVLVLDPSELDARFISAMSEAKKLGRWRGEAAQRLAQYYEQIGDLSVRQRILQEILFHLHATFQNTYHKIEKLRRQLTRVVVPIVLVTLASILGLNALFCPLGAEVQQTLWLAVIGGLTGGVLSVATSVVRIDPRRKIPEVSQSFLVTMTRPFVGATTAIPLLFFVESGLVGLGDPSKKPWVLLALCFVGGFSERWFLGIVKGLGHRAQAGGKSDTES